MTKQAFQTHYPDYNVLDKWPSPDWDDQTRAVVRKRLEDFHPYASLPLKRQERFTQSLKELCPKLIVLKQKGSDRRLDQIRNQLTS